MLVVFVVIIVAVVVGGICQMFTLETP